MPECGAKPLRDVARHGEKSGLRINDSDHWRKEAIMFTRILVPTDFSPPSDAALEYARLLAATFGASLHLLHVIDDPAASSAFVADGYAPNSPDIAEFLLTRGRTRLEALLNRSDREVFHATTVALVGEPAMTIGDYATASGTDLIVMGTHGRSGFAHALMGSVAERVVRTASCPVLTVKQPAGLNEVTVAVTSRHVPVPA
jgi:nucleotide-binding universal stress UspA family protein